MHAENKPYRKLMTKAQIETLFHTLQTANPTPTTELEYRSTFELLIAVILSAQATDVSVNKATRVLYAVANTPETLYALGVEGLKPYISTIGLYNSKAENIIATCKTLIEKHHSQVPSTQAALIELAGVGRKTANVILNTAFHQPVIAVDTHIFRLSNRTGLAPAKTVDAVEAYLMKRIPKPYLLDAHHWLILHGRYVCKARKPECERCSVSAVCQYKHKSL